MSMMNKLLLVVLVGGALCAGVAAPAWAQEPPPAYPAPPVATPGQMPGYHPTYRPPPRIRVTTRISRPNAVYVELLGRGLVYSVGYDHMVLPWLGFGSSFSYFQLSDVPTVFINPYVSFYPAGGIRNALLMQLGANFIYFGRGNDFFLPVDPDDGLEVIGNFGIGYEYRSGFLFRVMGMAFFSESGVIPWFGLAFGGSF